MGRSFCLAVGQSPAELSTPQDRLDWLANALPAVVAEGTDLLVLPELFAIGYNIGDQVVARSEPVDGPTARAIATLAKAHGVAIHYGFAEADGDAIFNAAQCFGPDGTRLGGHRKLAIPPGFERAHFTPGQGCTLFTYRDVRIATLICYDAEFPETARYVASLGAELILAPTALGAQWEWVAQRMIPTRAYENGVYLAYANSAGVENGMPFLGQSFIATPDGHELVRAGAQPEVIYGTLQLDKVSAAQTRLPYLRDRKALGPDIR
ncbi:carbon-nitrogen hydrolase family protein [Lentibacter algarum]|uniref:carbon-nitrogen hydrolase family protein n=1 Tax=Lentibacter algarum TaxID=576131 RepID=UPI0026F1787D|nr:carbon-nitrogen hydrolase family protein [Lentibacter algarum]MCH9787054.1 carbon-nitrogen hydrolase family protein [Gammaproteobacteria bacterium]MCH9824733.1 carbon-nitrogen hydrolase family protein [Alphaproteobacteria bacterium]